MRKGLPNPPAGKQKILITGFSGYLGSQLTQRLIKDKNLQIFGLTRNPFSLKILKFLPCLLKIRFISGCLEDRKTINKLNKLGQFDVIYHLAASLGNKKELKKTNIIGTKNLLEWACQHKIKKFIFTSSVEAPGPVSKKQIPADENIMPCPVSAYGKSKLEAEKLVLSYKNKIPSTFIFRVGNVFGPPGEQFILPIVKAIIQKNNLWNYYSLYKNHYLSLIFIENLVSFFQGLINFNKKQPAVSIYNLVDKNITIANLFENVVKIINKKLLVPVNLKANQGNLEKSRLGGGYLNYFLSGNPPKLHRAYSNKKVKKYLHYQPKYDFEEALKITLDWYKKRHYT